MTVTEKLHSINQRRIRALEALIQPAKAAANSMADAGMKETAMRLNAALFDVEAIDQEMSEWFKSDTEAIVSAIIESFKAKDGK